MQTLLILGFAIFNILVLCFYPNKVVSVILVLVPLENFALKNHEQHVYEETVFPDTNAFTETIFSISVGKNKRWLV